MKRRELLKGLFAAPLALLGMKRPKPMPTVSVPSVFNAPPQGFKLGQTVTFNGGKVVEWPPVYWVTGPDTFTFTCS